MTDKRLLQVFINDKSGNPGPGIFEVNTHSDKTLTCNCPGFMAKTSCKHVTLIKNRIDSNNGVYPFTFSDKVTTTELREAMASESSFRELVIKHGKIEVF